MRAGTIEATNGHQRYSGMEDQTSDAENLPPPKDTPGIVLTLQTLFQHPRIGIAIVKVKATPPVPILERFQCEWMGLKELP